MRSGGDKRGSSADRRRRKQWLLASFGDGRSCLCAHCNRRLTFRTVEADRILAGGSYAHHNIQPSCRRCNVRRWHEGKTAYAKYHMS